MLPSVMLAAGRVFFAVLTITAIVVQYWFVAGRPALNPANFFSFFTIQSNLFAATVFLATALLTRARVRTGGWDLVRGAATLYMVTTGIIYVLLLSGLEEALQTQVPWVNLVLHYMMPLAVLLDWIVDPPGHPIPFGRALVWLVYPAVYFAYSLARGPVAGWYPYPFLNPATAGGYGGVGLYAAAITFALIALIWILTWVGHRRRRGAVSVLATVLVLLAALPLMAAPLSSSSRVGPTGVGPIVFGTTPRQAATAAGVRFTPSRPSRGSTCSYLRPPVPQGLAFMVEHGTVRRAEVLTPALRTTDGFRVGDPAERITSFYGSRAHVRRDKYDPQARIVTVTPGGALAVKYRVVFTIKDGTVRAIFAGALPQVLYVEGCS